MNTTTPIACVTGASGMIGRNIVQRLLLLGYAVRVLTRNKHFDDPDIEVFYGDIGDERILTPFLRNAHYLFHCAAELRYEPKMWEVNVRGTERLLRLASQAGIQYLCYLSSAGVVGKTGLTRVDETAVCNPQNAYERSKWAAEQLVAQGIKGCRVVILRPTNVIDDERPGSLSLPIRGALFDWLKVFLKGGECAHLVHADDVAEAALYLTSQTIDSPACFFVSCDHERFNTFAGLWSLYKAVQGGQDSEGICPVSHAPLIIPHLLRRLWRGAGNYGNVRYSSEKLLSTGFRYHLGVEGAVRRIAALQRPAAS